jgi:hypothetical protein
MPLERVPDPPRVVVDGIEGRDTLYEFDLTAAPSPRGVPSFFGHRPPSRPPTIPPTSAAGRLILGMVLDPATRAPVAPRLVLFRGVTLWADRRRLLGL